MRPKKNQNPIVRLYLNLIEERRLLFFAFLSSIINKILDLAPPVIIGLAVDICLLYTSPSPRDNSGSRMPSSA